MEVWADRHLLLAKLMAQCYLVDKIPHCTSSASFLIHSDYSNVFVWRNTEVHVVQYCSSSLLFVLWWKTKWQTELTPPTVGVSVVEELFSYYWRRRIQTTDLALWSLREPEDKDILLLHKLIIICCRNFAFVFLSKWLHPVAAAVFHRTKQTFMLMKWRRKRWTWWAQPSNLLHRKIINILQEGGATLQCEWDRKSTVCVCGISFTSQHVHRRL